MIRKCFFAEFKFSPMVYLGQFLENPKKLYYKNLKIKIKFSLISNHLHFDIFNIVLFLAQFIYVCAD